MRLSAGVLWLSACRLAAAELPSAPASAAAEMPVAFPPEMAEPARLFRRQVDEIGARYREAVRSFPAQYTNELRVLLLRFQQDGNLDGVLAVAREQKRFSEAMRAERDPFELTPEMPPEAIVATPPELRQLQMQYVQRFKDAAAARQRGIQELTAKYLARLEPLQRELTRAGRIREAVAVKSEADRLVRAMAEGRLVPVAEAMAADPETAVPPAGGVTNNGIPALDAVPAWSRWVFLGVHRFARERTQFGNPDIPDELEAEFDPRSGRGRVAGRCVADAQQVGPVLSFWFGKALLWKVPDPSLLTATIELESRQLSTGENHGPYAQLALLAGGVPLKAIDVPLLAARTILRVVKDPNAGRCALMWPLGKITEIVELPEGEEIVLLLGITLRNPGESCDTAIALRP